jgi:DNA-binding CsgD family transcriptional regulator
LSRRHLLETLGRAVWPLAVARPFATPRRALLQATTRPMGLRARYGLPFVLVLMALVLADLATPILPGGGVFLLLLLPVMLSSIVRGPRSGVAALILGAAGSLLLVPLRGHPWLSDPTDVIRLALYVLVGALIVILVSGREVAVRTRPGRDPAPASAPGPPPAAPDPPPVEPLTRREIEVLRLAASGLSIEAIGRQLCLSRNTVKSHVAHTYGKLGAHNRTQAIGSGLRSGCLDQRALTARLGPSPRAWPSATKATTATSSGIEPPGRDRAGAR